MTGYLTGFLADVVAQLRHATIFYPSIRLAHHQESHTMPGKHPLAPTLDLICSLLLYDNVPLHCSGPPPQPLPEQNNNLTGTRRQFDVAYQILVVRVIARLCHPGPCVILLWVIDRHNRLDLPLPTLS